jgi:hypothetical protein
VVKRLRDVTPDEWFSCQFPGEMLGWLRTADARKLRLFACAACRFALWDLLTKEGRQLVEAAERWADGHITRNELNAIRAELQPRLPVVGLGRRELAAPARGAVITATPRKDALRDLIYHISVSTEDRWKNSRQAFVEDMDRHSHALHDIFDYLFLDVVFDPRWRSGEVSRVAAALYEGRKFDELPVLADALEDAGCAEATLLDHLRGPGPHVRGCWALDLILGKA